MRKSNQSIFEPQIWVLWPLWKSTQVLRRKILLNIS